MKSVNGNLIGMVDRGIQGDWGHLVYTNDAGDCFVSTDNPHGYGIYVEQHCASSLEEIIKKIKGEFIDVKNMTEEDVNGGLAKSLFAEIKVFGEQRQELNIKMAETGTNAFFMEDAEVWSVGATKKFA